MVEDVGGRAGVSGDDVGGGVAVVVEEVLLDQDVGGGVDVEALGLALVGPGVEEEIAAEGEDVDAEELRPLAEGPEDAVLEGEVRRALSEHAEGEAVVIEEASSIDDGLGVEAGVGRVAAGVGELDPDDGEVADLAAAVESDAVFVGFDSGARTVAIDADDHGLGRRAARDGEVAQRGEGVAGAEEDAVGVAVAEEAFGAVEGFERGARGEAGVAVVAGGRRDVHDPGVGGDREDGEAAGVELWAGGGGCSWGREGQCGRERAEQDRENGWESAHRGAG